MKAQTCQTRPTIGSARGGWMSFKRYTRELYDRPTASLLPLKAWMVRSEVLKALIYGCATWTPLKDHYANLRRTHHRMLLRILGGWCTSPNKRILSHKGALQRTECESIERPCARGGSCGRGRCSTWVTQVTPRGSCRESWRMREKVGLGGVAKERTDCVAEDLRLFGITGD